MVVDVANLPPTSSNPCVPVQHLTHDSVAQAINLPLRPLTPQLPAVALYLSYCTATVYTLRAIG